MNPAENDMLTQILLVDDNPGDIRLAREAFRDFEISVRTHETADGVDAMKFLKREGSHVSAPRPDMILLDLNLPKMDGREVLARIKADDELKAIPTIILTTSEADVDIVTCYQLHANYYFTKPPGFDAFQNLIRSIGEFWLTEARLPRRRQFAQAVEGATFGQR